MKSFIKSSQALYVIVIIFVLEDVFSSGFVVIDILEIRFFIIKSDIGLLSFNCFEFLSVSFA